MNTFSGRLVTIFAAAAAVAIAVSACQPVEGGTSTPSATATTSTDISATAGTHSGHTNSAAPSSSPAAAGMPMVNPYVKIDSSKIPTGSKGSPDRLLNEKGGQPKGSDIGAFRTVCGFSHMSYDDPILFPGKKNATHLHTFFGNTGADYASTPDSIANKGNSTCRGGILDRTAYWAPALINIKTGVPLTPKSMDGYYKNGYGGVQASVIKELPKGLRMIAGSAKATSGQAKEVGQWGCDDGTSRPYKYWNSIPDYCKSGDTVGFDTAFPQCWDGKNLSSANGKDHVAYPIEGKGCPASHPVGMPQVGIIVNYVIPAGVTVADLRLSSDMYEKGPGGYSFHADWYDGWDPATKTSWTNTCNKGVKDCFSDVIAPGKSLYGEL